jgi:hypothetical protein
MTAAHGADWRKIRPNRLGPIFFLIPNDRTAGKRTFGRQARSLIVAGPAWQVKAIGCAD